MMFRSRPSAPAASPLRGRYLVRNPLPNAWLRLNDLVLGVLRAGDVEAPGNRASPKRVLVALGGHLGDAVIASAFLTQVKRTFPAAEIGIVCGSWSRRVFESHPLVRWIHVVDHWKLSRGDGSLLGRWLTARRTHTRALEEIRSVGYDAGFDLAVYFPNSARLLWSAGIPVRVGYTSGGDGPLFTDGVPWSARSHVAEEHAALLARLVPAAAQDVPARYELGEIPAAAARRAETLLNTVALSANCYVVVHMGAGHPRKEWPADKWTAVVRELAVLGVRSVLTGAGERQEEQGRSVADGVPGTVSFVGTLTWDEFRAVVAGARLVLTVDTVAMHLAGAASRPCVALMTGMDRPERWSPLGSPATILTERVPCAPCFRSRGCAQMSCVRDVSVASVLEAVRAHLHARTPVVMSIDAARV